MTTALKLRRGTTAQHASFTGAVGEVTVDTTKKTAVVHDGSTAGGTPLAKESALSTKADTTYVDGKFNTTFAFKNRIINGDMRIDQRNAGASVTITNTAATTYTLDRWYAYGSQASKFSVQQSTSAPAGFKNSLAVTSASAYTVTSSDLFILGQSIEGFNVSDLAWGTVDAKTITLTCRVYSSLTGTFGASVLNSAQARSYPFTYTISAANTWTTVSVTIPGDTSGTWLTDNGVGLKIYWGLGVGSTYSGTAGAWASATYFSATGATSVVGTNAATFRVTGVQLEVGSSATPFDTRAYGTELALCQRYFFSAVFGYFTGICLVSVPNRIAGFSRFPVTMRASPTITIGSTDIDNVAGFGSPSVTTVDPDMLSRIDVNNGVASRVARCSYNASAEL